MFDYVWWFSQAASKRLQGQKLPQCHPCHHGAISSSGRPCDGGWCLTSGHLARSEESSPGHRWATTSLLPAACVPNPNGHPQQCPPWSPVSWPAGNLGVGLPLVTVADAVPVAGLICCCYMWSYHQEVQQDTIVWLHRECLLFIPVPRIDPRA